MKQSITRYVIMDPTTDLFWQRTNFYAMDFGPVYYARFSKSLAEANLMSEPEAREVFNNLKVNKFTEIAELKVNTGNLIITPITITYEI